MSRSHHHSSPLPIYKRSKLQLLNDLCTFRIQYGFLKARDPPTLAKRVVRVRAFYFPTMSCGSRLDTKSAGITWKCGISFSSTQSRGIQLGIEHARRPGSLFPWAYPQSSIAYVARLRGHKDHMWLRTKGRDEGLRKTSRTDGVGVHNQTVTLAGRQGFNSSLFWNLRSFYANIPLAKLFFHGRHRFWRWESQS